MVQEVQTQGNRYQTPNLIPGVGLSERRVKEHTQIYPSFGYECTAGGSISMGAESGQSKEGDATLSITDSSGDTKFRIIENGVCVPLAGAYYVKIAARGGVSGASWEHEIKLGNKTIVSVTTYVNNADTIVEKVLNLGRYNILKYHAKYHNGSAGYLYSTGSLTITLKKL